MGTCHTDASKYVVYFKLFRQIVLRSIGTYLPMDVVHRESISREERGWGLRFLRQIEPN